MYTNTNNMIPHILQLIHPPPSAIVFSSLRFSSLGNVKERFLHVIDGSRKPNKTKKRLRDGYVKSMNIYYHVIIAATETKPVNEMRNEQKQ